MIVEPDQSHVGGYPEIVHDAPGREHAPPDATHCEQKGSSQANRHMPWPLLSALEDPGGTPHGRVEEEKKHVAGPHRRRQFENDGLGEEEPGRMFGPGCALRLRAA